MSRINRKPTKSQSFNQRRDSQERRRDERTAQNTYRKVHKDCSYLATDEQFVSFSAQLRAVNLENRDVPGDGNCLFRALGDQMDGHVRNHSIHRADTVKYMLNHRDDFEPFVEDDVPFDEHMSNLARLGTFGGNDSIVAFARLHGVNVVIHQLNAPDWRVPGSHSRPCARDLHIAYHNGDHYSSVRKLRDKSHEPTKFRMSRTGNTVSTGGKSQHRDKNGTSSREASTNHSPAAWSDESFCNGSIDDMVVQVMDATGYQDASFISDSLEENQFDVAATIEFILVLGRDGQLGGDESSSHQDVAVSSNGLWSSGGTGSRIFGETIVAEDKTSGSGRATGRRQGGKATAANKHIAKEKKRTEKKERQTERHKERILGRIKAPSPPPAADTEIRDCTSALSVAVGQMGSLTI